MTSSRIPGFAFLMIFGHAPAIFPGVAGTAAPAQRKHVVGAGR